MFDRRKRTAELANRLEVWLTSHGPYSAEHVTHWEIKNLILLALAEVMERSTTTISGGNDGEST